MAFSNLFGWNNQAEAAPAAACGAGDKPASQPLAVLPAAQETSPLNSLQPAVLPAAQEISLLNSL